MNSAKLKLLTIVVAAVFILRLTQTFTSSSSSMENTDPFSKNMVNLRLLEQARKEIEQLRNEQRTSITVDDKHQMNLRLLEQARKEIEQLRNEQQTSITVDDKHHMNLRLLEQARKEIEQLRNEQQTKITVDDKHQKLLEQAREEIEELKKEQQKAETSVAPRHETKGKDWKFAIVVFVGHRVEVIRRTLKALSKAKRFPRSTPCIFVLDIKAGQEKEFQEVQSDGVIFSLRILLASHSSRAAF